MEVKTKAAKQPLSTLARWLFSRILRISGYPDILKSGFLDIRIPGYPAIRISADIRISGYPDIRISGYPDFRLSGFPDIRISGYIDSVSDREGRYFHQGHTLKPEPSSC